MTSSHLYSQNSHSHSWSVSRLVNCPISFGSIVRSLPAIILKYWKNHEAMLLMQEIRCSYQFHPWRIKPWLLLDPHSHSWSVSRLVNCPISFGSIVRSLPAIILKYWKNHEAMLLMQEISCSYQFHPWRIKPCLLIDHTVNIHTHTNQASPGLPTAQSQLEAQW